jgi:3-oxoadipate enol-lactonase
MPCLMRPWGHMHYWVDGPESGHAAVFATSLGTDLRMWQGVSSRLTGRRILFDKRGHGLSATPSQPWTVADLASDVVALLDHLGVARAAIIGCSVGGMVAQVMGAQHPGRVTHLVLSNTAARIGSADGWQARVDAVRQGGMAAIADAVLERWFAPEFRTSADSLPWRTMLLQADTGGYTGTCKALAQADLRGMAAAITAPVLMLAGTADQATPPELVAETAAMISGARVELLDGSGHIPAIDAPDKVARLIKDFAGL